MLFCTDVASNFGPLGPHLGSFGGPFGDLSGLLGTSWDLLGPGVRVTFLKNAPESGF